MKDLRLLNVSKPVRYVNNEINAVKKNPEGLFRFCITFPDVYEIGMSHIGFKLLYEKMNESSDIYCERFFTPWPDAIETMGKEIFISLETGTPISQFDVIGFSLQYELAYTTMLGTLNYAGIPIRSADRGENDPIIVAGGSCVLNPMPISRFVDVFFAGEMDTALRPVMEELHALRKAGKSRDEQLAFLDSFPFTYVPRLNPTKQVTRSIYKEFDQDVTIKKLPVSLMPAIQDRVAVEISRGCSRGCRFCQAGNIYRPVRERSVATLVADAANQVACSGYFDVSMLSLSAADYTDLENLLMSMSETFRDSRVGLAMPSLRADKITEKLFSELSKVRKSGFTIAPEAGSQRMRDIINKNLTEEEIIRAVKTAADAEWNGAKLYFMIGLPFETKEDIAAIADLAGKVKRELKYHKKGFAITVSVSNFVPKAHTPFQWAGQDSPQTLREKQDFLAEKMKQYKIRFKYHGTAMSEMEGVFSRGDARLGDVLEVAVKHGRMFDAWSEHFSYHAWQDVFKEAGYTTQEFAQRVYDVDKPLPWSHISSGIDEDFLRKEYQRAEQAVTTVDCRIDHCTACGVCDFKDLKNVFAEQSTVTLPNRAEQVEPEYNTYALVFTKDDVGRFLSAIEMGRIFMHALFVAGVNLKFSQGFNPQPKLNYFMPLSVGAIGENELILIQAATLADTEAVRAELNRLLPDGVVVKELRLTEQKKPSQETVLTYRLEAELLDIMNASLASGEAYYVKDNKKGVEKKVDFTDFLLEQEGNVFKVASKLDGTFNLTEFFRFKGVPVERINVVRTDVGIVY